MRECTPSRDESGDKSLILLTSAEKQEEHMPHGHWGLFRRVDRTIFLSERDSVWRNRMKECDQFTLKNAFLNAWKLPNQFTSIFLIFSSMYPLSQWLLVMAMCWLCKQTRASLEQRKGHPFCQVHLTLKKKERKCPFLLFFVFIRTWILVSFYTMKVRLNINTDLYIFISLFFSSERPS